MYHAVGGYLVLCKELLECEWGKCPHGGGFFFSIGCCLAWSEGLKMVWDMGSSVCTVISLEFLGV